MTAKATVSFDKKSEEKKSEEKSVASTTASSSIHSSLSFTAKASSSSLSPALSFGTVGGGGGFFSLGESNIAERAKRLKEERKTKTMTNNSKQKEFEKNGVANGGGDGDSISSKISNAASKDDDSIVSKASVAASERAMLHEFDFLLISNQAGETDNVLHKSLLEGFRGLTDKRISLDRNEDRGDATEDQRKYSATVNFIDPTTKETPPPESSSGPPTTLKSVTSIAAKTTNLLQQQSMLSKRSVSSNSQASAASTNSTDSSRISNVYEKLTHIFENEYASTIRSVQYKNVRTGEVNTIRSLPVRSVLSRTGSTGRGPSTDPSSLSPTNTPWGGTSAMLPVSDPSEWHTGPFCHVYIAACEDVDHYRTKVRPSLRAFVSQLESSDSNTAANQQGGHSADYLIVYIPIGDGGAGKGNNEASNNQGGGSNNNKANANSGRLGFFGIGRQRFAGGGTTNTAGTDAQMDGDDLSSKDSMESGDERLDMSNRSGFDSDDGEKGALNVLMTFNHLSKVERSLYKKIATNFPNGKVCVLSATSLERVTNEEESTLAVRAQEWNVFSRLLGQVIVNGFQDRIKRYKVELKRLDAQRAIAATAAKNYVTKGSNSNKSSKPNPYAFNLGHFFLVKESLASSYEQMQLPTEALLQYDEFRLYMPDLSDKEESKVRKARRKSRALHDESPEDSLTRLADAGDFLGFRKKIRSEYDLTAILDIMRRYLFARELALLFRMEEPVEILSRCQAFVKVMYSILLRGVSELDEKDQRERKAKAATWVVQFSWDIYCATRQYLNSPPAVFQEQNLKSRNSQSDEAVGAKLSDILEVSRLFLLQLAEDYAESLGSFTTRRKSFPNDLQMQWSPWTACEPKTNDYEKNADPLGFPGNASQNQNTDDRQFVMTYEDTLMSIDKFEETYLKICGAIIEARQVAKHIRLAARIYAEVGEHYASKGDLLVAAASFQKIVKIYRMDHWDHSHFWRVFRLAYCQRTTAEPAAYLKTLCSCFSPRSSAVAPKDALAALFDDLKRVIGHASIGNARYSRLLFIETSMSISSGSDETEKGVFLIQKEIEKRICPVGETLKIPISITSHLPGFIQLTSVKLFAVTVGTFKTILANGDAVQEEDSAEVLSIDVPINLNPGKNDFEFEWTPTRPGQYILSTVEILWKQGYFYYDSMDLQEPLLSIEIVPKEATHSVSLEPSELVPGHDQEVNITFYAGSDWITCAKLNLSGTNNDDDILLIPPGDDTNNWRQSWETELGPLKPGDKQVLTAKVRCALDRSKGLPPNLSGSEDDEDSTVNTSRGLIANMVTTYLFAPAEDEDFQNELPSMKKSLEAFAPVLKKAALSIESVETNWLDDGKSDSQGRFLLSVVLISNALCRFTIDELEMNMASPLRIVSGSDMDLNENVLHRYVCDGDRLSLAFECVVEEEDEPISVPFKGSNMRLKLCDDEGKKFSVDLPLDLGLFPYSSQPSGFDFKNIQLKKAPTGSRTSTVLATLTLEQNQGLVGESLQMTFVVDTRSLPDLANDGDLCWVYSIDCSTGQWLLGGKVNGILKSQSETKLSVVGVPVVPGVLDHFPVITIERCDSSSGSSMPIHVECRQPEAFQSMPITQLNAIATPRFEHL